MNKIFKIVLCLILTSSITNCKSTTPTITINQTHTDYDIIIKSAKDNKNDIINIRFPRNITIFNNFHFNKSFIKIDYYYKDSLSDWANRNIELYKIYGGRLERISNNKKKTISSKDSLSFVFYTRHFLDSTKATQQQFKPYIEKMLEENRDTLHIGSVSEFKTKHAALFEKLTKNDSISIQFLDGRELGERITVPVEW